MSGAFESASDAAPAALGRFAPRVGGRSLTRAWPDLRAALAGLLLVAPLAASNGGYYPTAWGWSALAFAWAGAVALALGEPAVARHAPVLLGSLLCLAVWTGASTIWSADVGQSVLETERIVVYVAGVGAAFVIVTPSSYRALLGGIWLAGVLVCGYALLTRLLPERLGVFDAIAGYRLSEPLGYWNALGILAAITTVLGAGFASRASGIGVRLLAGASLPLTVTALYFTFSRGSWIALAIGLAAATLADGRPTAFATGLVVLAPFPALVVWISSGRRGLTRVDSSLALASSDGHHVIGVLAWSAAGGALTAGLLTVAARRIRASDTLRRAHATLLVLAFAGAAAFIFVSYGSPATLARKAYDSFAASPSPQSADLNKRLFTLSGGRRELWTTALHDFEGHPVLGTGAGSYERYWLRHRTSAGKVRDAHSLYLETLAELGLPGFGLLVAVLVAPLLAAARVARRRPLVPAALGAYVAYLVHAGVDWDWEMTAVTLAALLCGAAMVLAGTSQARPFGLARSARVGGLVAAAVVGGFAFVGLVGNRAIASADHAGAARRWSREERDARKAIRWAPWSTEGRRLLAEAQYARGRASSARATLRRALADDPGDWLLWFNLAAASQGQARAHALRSALRLNPHSPEVAEYMATLRASSR